MIGSPCIKWPLPDGDRTGKPVARHFQAYYFETV